MYSIQIKESEIIYDKQKQRDTLIRRVQFTTKGNSDRCSMDPQPMFQVYPLSYIHRNYNCITTKGRYSNTTQLDVYLPDFILTGIKDSIDSRDLLVPFMEPDLPMLLVDMDMTSLDWTSKSYCNINIRDMEQSTGVEVIVNGKLEIYLSFVHCSKNNDSTCYNESHGTVWELRGKFISGTIGIDE